MASPEALLVSGRDISRNHQIKLKYMVLAKFKEKEEKSCNQLCIYVTKIYSFCPSGCHGNRKHVMLSGRGPVSSKISLQILVNLRDPKLQYIYFFFNTFSDQIQNLTTRYNNRG